METMIKVAMVAVLAYMIGFTTGCTGHCKPGCPEYPACLWEDMDRG